MYSPASNFVEGVDNDFKIIFGISLFFLAGITLVMLFFVFRYSRKRHPIAVQIKDNIPMEIAWTVVPLIIVLLLFYYGYMAYAPMRNVPEGALQIKATGKMWVWSFEYENGKEFSELVVPLNKPVKLNLVSLDVIHSLYIPAFRIKEDLVPGQENYMWFIPEKLGVYEILCAEYCGLRHSFMESKVRVLTEEHFKQWLDSLPVKETEPAGLTIIKQNACTGCHSLDGSKLVSSSFKGLYGTKRTITDDNNNESEVLADSTYIINSILDPQLQSVKGYPKGLMKSYKGILKDSDIQKIIEYLKNNK
jgi:cytochrome c oxidase subunit 2